MKSLASLSALFIIVIALGTTAHANLPICGSYLIPSNEYSTQTVRVNLESNEVSHCTLTLDRRRGRSRPRFLVEANSQLSIYNVSSRIRRNRLRFTVQFKRREAAQSLVCHFTQESTATIRERESSRSRETQLEALAWDILRPILEPTMRFDSREFDPLAGLDDDCPRSLNLRHQEGDDLDLDDL